MSPEARMILQESCKEKAGLLGNIIVRHSLFQPHREAFVYGDQRVTFEQYNKRVNSLIQALKHMGMKKGGIIGVLSWNCLEYTDVFGAAAKGGYIITPINARLSINEVEYVINDSEASILFVGPELAETVNTLKSKLSKVKHYISFEGPLPDMECYADLLSRYPSIEPDVEIGDNDPIYICYTSGTTGKPRGALYTHDRFREAILCHAIEEPIEPSDKGLCHMPLFHIGGIIVDIYYFYRAATTVLMKNFNAVEFLKIIEKEKITNIGIVPTHLAMMLEVPDLEKYNISSIKRIHYAGSPMPTELLRRGMKLFGLVFVQAYGQTECGPDIAFLKENEHDVLDKSAKEQEKLLSCGHPASSVQVRITDGDGNDVLPGEIGEIIVKSRHIMSEYWKKPEETKETLVDGWVRTGDIGRYDESGYIYLVDRKKDMIVSGGENIYPREVEEVLYKHPAVLECAVFGIPHPKWVEQVHAVVTLKQGALATPEELMEYCKNNITKYKAPKSLDIVQEIPKSGAGKILKREMRKKYWPIT